MKLAVVQLYKPMTDPRGPSHGYSHSFQADHTLELEVRDGLVHFIVPKPDGSRVTYVTGADNLQRGDGFPVAAESHDKKGAPSK